MKSERISTRGLVGILCALAVMIVGLSVGIGVVINGSGVVEGADISSDIEVEMEERAEALEKTIFELQEKINTADNEGEIARLYNERMLVILNSDTSCGEYGELAIESAIKLDDYYETVDTASGVVDVAEFCGDVEIQKRYSDVVEVRKGSMPAHPDVETRG